MELFNETLKPCNTRNLVHMDDQFIFKHLSVYQHVSCLYQRRETRLHLLSLVQCCWKAGWHRGIVYHL